jgi:hypothetical protein
MMVVYYAYSSPLPETQPLRTTRHRLIHTQGTDSQPFTGAECSRVEGSLQRLCISRIIMHILPSCCSFSRRSFRFSEHSGRHIKGTIQTKEATLAHSNPAPRKHITETSYGRSRRDCRIETGRATLSERRPNSGSAHSPLPKHQRLHKPDHAQCSPPTAII